jgi:AbrB family looped-hinge helix DNA binding protein
MTVRVKVGARGQVVIPKELRESLGLRHGSVLEVDVGEDELVLRPADPVRELRGMGKGVFGDPVEFQRRLRREWEESPSTPTS